MCRLFIGQKFRRKFTPNPARCPSSKNTDSGQQVDTTLDMTTTHKFPLQELEDCKANHRYSLKHTEKTGKELTMYPQSCSR